MGRLVDRDEIRRRLELDRPWAVYALGDLAPGYWEQSEWHAVDGAPEALALLYRAGEYPVLFTRGEADDVQALACELPPEPHLFLSIRPEHLPAIERRWHVLQSNAMWRMLLDPSAPAAAPAPRVAPVRPVDEPALRSLFEDGRAAGEEPDFFFSSMLDAGTYFGVWDGPQLVAAAGTHLVASCEGVATIGNVYVRRDRRGEGLAGSVVGAVVAELRRREIRTVALNVRQTNTAALRAYERVGFRSYCAFLEGKAVLR